MDEHQDRKASVLLPGAHPGPATEGDEREGRERVPILVPRRVEIIGVREVLRVLVCGAHRPVHLLKETSDT